MEAVLTCALCHLPHRTTSVPALPESIVLPITDHVLMVG